MPRKNLIRTSEFPYHVTIRTNNKEWFNLPLKEVWQMCLLGISETVKRHEAKIQAFVLMNNHYHLLIWTPKSNLDKFMQMFNSRLSKEIRKSTGNINRIFGDRYHWCLIKDEKYHQSVLRYIYQNPLRAGISKRCESYEFSTLKYFINEIDLGFKLCVRHEGSNKYFLRWLNQELDTKSSKKLTTAISKPIFKISVERSSRRKF